MSRKSRTIPELRQASIHLRYHVNMLKSLAMCLASGVAGDNTVLANALTEHFVIYVRGLMDFLYSRQPEQDDVIAEDFFAKRNEWSRKRPPLSALLADAKARAGQKIAHLAYTHLDTADEDRPWQFMDIATEIESVIEIFATSVPKAKLDSVWNKLVD